MSALFYIFYNKTRHRGDAVRREGKTKTAILSQDGGTKSYEKEFWGYAPSMF